MNKDHLLSEYLAISAYFNNVINFRFIVFGFYIGSITLLISQGFSESKAIILIAISSILWIFELRNRGLSGKLINLAIQIEDFWPKLGSNKMHFFHSLKEKEESDEIRIFGKSFKSPKLIKYQGKEIVELLGAKINNQIKPNKNEAYTLSLISHSFALDVAYLSAIFFSFLFLISSFFLR